MLKPGGTYGEGDEALEFYAKHTAQIEVSWVHVPPKRGHFGSAAIIFVLFKLIPTTSLLYAHYLIS